MVKTKHKARHFVGYCYNANQLPKEKQSYPSSISSRKYKPKRKHVLHSKRIETCEKIGYIEARRHFKFNYLDFICRTENQRVTTSSLDKATVFLGITRLQVEKHETYPYMKHFLIAVPHKLWRSTEDKQSLLNALYPKKYYPDLYLK